jgi:hypothetical protein
MIGDFAVFNAHDINRLEVDLAVSWSNPKKRPIVGVKTGLCSNPFRSP